MPVREVDHAIEPAVLLEGDADEHVDLLAIHHVDRTSDHGRAASGRLGRDVARPGLVDVAHHDAGALGRGRQHAAPADALPRHRSR